MYDKATADRLCEEIASGRSLRSVCADDGMPDKATVFRWLAKDETFRDQYARAREMQTDALLEEIFEIADQYDAASDAVNPDHINRAKLRIDTRKWAMGKMAPKKYGDKLDVGVDGQVVVKVMRFADDGNASE